MSIDSTLRSNPQALLASVCLLFVLLALAGCGAASPRVVTEPEPLGAAPVAVAAPLPVGAPEPVAASEPMADIGVPEAESQTPTPPEAPVDVCTELMGQLDAQPRSLGRTRVLRAAVDGHASDECIQRGVEDIMSGVRRTAALTDEELMLEGLRRAIPPEEYGLAAAEASAGSNADLLQTYWRRVSDEFRPMLGADVAEFDALIARILSRFAWGASRGAPLVPFDFRRVVLDPTTIGTVHTCRVGNAPSALVARRSGATDRPFDVDVYCYTYDGTTAHLVVLGLTAEEALVVLEASGRWLALRITSVDAYSLVHASLDVSGTRVLAAVQAASQ